MPKKHHSVDRGRLRVWRLSQKMGLEQEQGKNQVKVSLRLPRAAYREDPGGLDKESLANQLKANKAQKPKLEKVPEAGSLER